MSKRAKSGTVAALKGGGGGAGAGGGGGGGGGGFAPEEYEEGVDLLVKRSKFRPSALSSELSRYMGDPQFEEYVVNVTDGGMSMFQEPSDGEVKIWEGIPLEKRASLVRDVFRAVALRAHAGLGEFDRGTVINIIKNRAVQKLSAP